MAVELLSSVKYSRGVVFDPRTKWTILITLIMLIFGGSYQTTLLYLPAILPLLMALTAKMWKASVIYTLIIIACLFFQEWSLPNLSGVLSYLIAPMVILPLYFAPCMMASYVLVKTTTVSEFVAAMESLHMPKQITIPIAVMFRFFPTIMEEWSAIADAMKMRGIRWKGHKVGSMLEYRIVPMMLCSVKIGEELSIASLTRGLGGPIKRTNVCEIGFHIQDAILFILCLACLTIQALLSLGVLV